MATKTQQRDWLKLVDDNDAPTGHSLKGWLFGGQAIRTKVALFDLATYSGKIVGDLFSEDGYFANAEDFWTAQDEAIAARRDALSCRQMVRSRGAGTRRAIPAMGFREGQQEGWRAGLYRADPYRRSALP